VPVAVRNRTGLPLSGALDGRNIVVMTTDALRTRPLTIVAQDPSIRFQGRILRAAVEVPAEDLAAGPWGHRVQVIDYDATTQTLYKPLDPSAHAFVGDVYADPYASATDRQLLQDPNFHAQNVYTIVMSTLARFEFALGRRVNWGFNGHQLKVVPHAFADANAFYADRDEALLFGYFKGMDGGPVFTCLSHDIIAHETTHALVAGLRERFTDPASPDQAAFHEGFADVVALLSVYALPGIVERLIDARGSGTRAARQQRFVAREDVSVEALRRSILFGLAKQMGQELSRIRGQALRQSALLKPSPKYYQNDPEYVEPHRRGELFVAPVMNAFLHVWSDRLSGLGEIAPGHLDRARVVEEGAAVADALLTIAIRALDYTPPVQLEFGDFLSALITADAELRPADTKHRFRRHLLENFARFGIAPASKGTAAEPGVWDRPDGEKLIYSRTHFESMQRDPDEVFRFIWDNRKELLVYEGAYGHVLSVRPCLRIAPDGFALRETVAQFYQVLKVTAAELKSVTGVRPPSGIPEDTVVSLYGGNTLIFDEYGQLKFNIHNRIDETRRQQRRLDYLWESGFFAQGIDGRRRFASMHVRKAMDASLKPDTGEEW
jgi:hypothetical protein